MKRSSYLERVCARAVWIHGVKSKKEHSLEDKEQEITQTRIHTHTHITIKKDT